MILEPGGSQVTLLVLTCVCRRGDRLHVAQGNTVILTARDGGTEQACYVTSIENARTAMIVLPATEDESFFTQDAYHIQLSFNPVTCVCCYAWARGLQFRACVLLLMLVVVIAE